MSNIFPILLSSVLSWVCFYGPEFPPNSPSYDLYVLAQRYHPEIAQLKEKGAVVVGYVSIGEINIEEPVFKKVPKNLLVEENEDWKGAYRIRIASPKWRKIVLDVLIPEVLSKGFDGIFLDTVDVAWYLENEKKMKGTVKGVVRLISEIRRRYPKIVILMNNGLFISETVGEKIDGLVVEDVFTLYDSEKKKYNMASDEWTRERLIPIKKFQEKFKKPVFSLDYLLQNDSKSIESVKKSAKQEGLIPYISDIDLQKIFFHPYG